MTDAYAPTEGHAQQTARVQQFFTWLLRLLLPPALLELAAFVVTQLLPLALAGSLTLAIVGLGVYARALVRRGALRTAVSVFCAGFLGIAVVGVIVLPLLLPALTVVALLVVALGLPYLDRPGLRRLLLGAGGVGVLTTVLARLPLIQQLFPPLPPLLSDVLVVVGVTVSLGLTLLLLWQFSSRLRETLDQTQAANRALQAAQADLEAQVAARTAALQTTIEELQASQAAIREIGAPILPIAPGVLVAPLIGALDNERVANLAAKLLGAVQQRRAQAVILDITGVPTVDTSITHALLLLGGAVRLLGAQVSIVGIRAEVAQAIVGLGIDLPGIQTFRDLQSALAQLVPSHAASHN